MFDYSRIQKLLDEKRMSANDMCKSCGISSGNVSDWKSGRSSPSAEKYCLMADFFYVSVDYLMGRDELPKADTPDAQELLRIFNSADREGKTIILATAFKEKRRMQNMEE